MSGFPDIEAIKEIGGREAKVLRKPFQLDDLLETLVEAKPAYVSPA